MRLQSCFPVDQNLSVDIEYGDVISVTSDDGIAVFSINGTVVGLGDSVFRVIPKERTRISTSEWPDQARLLAAEIVALWQNRQHAGIKLIELRKTTQLIRSDLGYFLGVVGQTVYRWESNETFPTEKHIDNFRELFGV